MQGKKRYERPDDEPFSKEQIEKARLMQEENQKKCDDYVKRQQKQKLAEQARSVASDVAKSAAAAEAFLKCREVLESEPPVAPPEEVVSTSLKRPCRRPVPSPQTLVQSRPPAVPVCELLWKDDNTGFAQYIMACPRDDPTQIPEDFVDSILRDGAALEASVEHGCLTNEFQRCQHPRWRSADSWKNVASSLHCTSVGKDRIKLQDDNGLGLTMVGSGTFNVVFRQAVGAPAVDLPVVHMKNVVLRLTRPDRDKNGQTRYQEEYYASKELHTSLFASANGVGVRVLAASIYEGIREARSMKFGTFLVLEQAKGDLHRTLTRVGVKEAKAAEWAVATVNLLCKASLLGMVLFDIKPGNILVFHDGRVRLTDFDSAFCLIKPKEDWRALVLINVLLLSCHVRNIAIPEVCRGWQHAVRPMLQQMLQQRRSEYDSQWLFDVCCVRLKTDSDGNDHFRLQRMLASIASSYLYPSDKNNGAPSHTHPWKYVPEQALTDFWKAGEGTGWPSRIDGKPVTPLVEQLFAFAMSYVEDD
jgi:hypothetical protein